MEPIYLTNLTWPQVERLLAQDDRLILVTGATEQHGHHLPLGTDNFIPLTLAERLSARTGIPIAPPLPIGMSESHMAFPGSFTFSTDTLKGVYLELVQSAYRNGWRRLFVINGHGGNIPICTWVISLAMKIKKDLKIHATHWWQEKTARQYVYEQVGRNENHAGLEESAAMLISRPELVHLKEAISQTNAPEDIWTRPPAEVRRLVPSGAIGSHPAQATKELGEEMLARLIEEYVEFVNNW